MKKIKYVGILDCQLMLLDGRTINGIKNGMEVPVPDADFNSLIIRKDFVAVEEKKAEVKTEVKKEEVKTNA